MAKEKVLLTRRLPRAVETAMGERFDIVFNEADVPLEEGRLMRAMREYDAICSTVTDAITAEILSAPRPRVKIIANYGVGYEHIDLAAAGRSGIAVTNTPDVLTDATADLAMTLMLMVARRAGEGERQVRENRWQGWYPTHMMGAMVTGRTLGIVGMGRIGAAVARRARHGFGMRILYCNRKPASPEVTAGLDAEYCPHLKELLERAGFVSLHCPSSPGTRLLMNAERLGWMKPSAFLINTARGNVVDESALIKALEAGKIAGAGLDVYETEPRVPDALKKLDNVVLLPHLGSATMETRVAMGMRVLNNLKAFFAGREPPDRLV